MLAVLAIALNPSEKKLAGLAEGVIHSAWPIVGVLVALWVAARFYPATFAPYAAALGIIRGAFLPVYGAALLAGLTGVGLITLVPALQKRRQSAGLAAPGKPLSHEAGAAMGEGATPLAPRT